MILQNRALFGASESSERTMPIHPEIELFWRFIVSSVDQIITCLDGLTEAEINWRPVESTNSLFVLAVHTMGNLEENLFSVLCGQPVQRQREAEFVAQGHSDKAIQQQWHELQQCVYAGLAQLPAIELDRKRQHPRRGQLTGREILLVVARHAAEHMGQAQLTRDLLFAARSQRSPA